MPDWGVIQRDYETSAVSLRTLATKHGVPLGTLYGRSRKWNRTPNSEQKSGTPGAEPLRIVRSELPSVASAVDGAKLGIVALVEYLRLNTKHMDLSDHVKAATALAQYNRIIVLALPTDVDEIENTQTVTINTNELTRYQLGKFKEFALAMKQPEEQEDFSSFSDDEVRQYAEFQERARKR